jgi:hypothetical protein
MRYRNLWGTLLIVYFAQSAVRPFQSAVLRLSGAYGGLAVVGYVLARSVGRAHLPVDVPFRIAFLMVAALGFTFSGLLFLAVHQSQEGKHAEFARLTRLLPLGRTLRWLVQIFPGLVLVGLLGVLGAPLVLALET